YMKTFSMHRALQFFPTRRSSDLENDLDKLCNKDMVELEPLDDQDRHEIKTMIQKHFMYTGSDPAEWILENWEVASELFVKVMPRDRKSTRLNSSHVKISYAVFCL